MSKLPAWQDRGYIDDPKAPRSKRLTDYAATRNDADCPKEECGHKGKDHSPEFGCLVEQHNEYCPCALAPIDNWTDSISINDFGDRTPGRWPFAIKQRDLGVIWPEDEE